MTYTYPEGGPTADLLIAAEAETLGEAFAQIAFGMFNVITPLSGILEKEEFNMIYTCGPEQMMYEMLVLAQRCGTPLQASLERLMRSAVGLCGSCTIGRFMVCKDGPIFSDKQLKEVKDEFGRFVRDRTGKKASLQSP